MIINYSEISNVLVNRNDLLDKEEVKRDIECINNGSPILFLGNDSEELRKVNNVDIYYVILHGITPSGMNVSLLIKSRPSLYIRIPDKYLGLDTLNEVDIPDLNMLIVTFINAIRAKVTAARPAKYGIKTIKWPEYYITRKYRSSCFQVVKGYYIKLLFDSLADRNDTINIITEEDILGYRCETGQDDKSSYYRTMFRTRKISPCTWMRITNYKQIYNGLSIKELPHHKFNGKYMLYLNDIDIETLSEDQIPNELKKDKSICIGWDIEAYRNENDGALPNPRDPYDEVFTIALAIGYYHSDPMLKICIVSAMCEDNPDFLTIVCKDERQLLLAFAYTFAKIQPQFIYGFNDGQFDWPFIAERARLHIVLHTLVEKMSILYTDVYLGKENKNKYLNTINPLGIKIVDNNVLDYMKCELIIGDRHLNGERSGKNFSKEEIKLSADTSVYIYQLKFTGCIPVDVMCIFRVIEKDPEQYSLNYFLNKYNLGSKDDLSVYEMFNIYRRIKQAKIDNDNDTLISELSNMAKIAKYCVVDAEACNKLMLKGNVISDRRILSNLSYTTARDGIYRADGIRVNNYAMGYALNRDIVFSNIYKRSNNNEKFLGGKVVKPTKGMQTTKLSLRELRQAHNKNLKWSYTWNDHSIKDLNYDLSDEELIVYENWILENYFKIKTLQLDNKPLDDYYDMIMKLPCNHNTEFYKFILSGTGLPVSGLDFSSLYPSIIMAFNLSPERMIIKEPDDIDGTELHKKAAYIKEKFGYDLYHIKFQYAGSFIEAYSVRHKFNPEIHPISDMDKQGFGVYPSILYDLYYKRKSVTKQRDEMGEKLKELTEGTIEYSEAQFYYNYYDNKQKVVKVFMNTIYGVTGSVDSPLYMLEISGGITSTGQRSLGISIDTILKQGCDVLYGDTDSAYVRCNERLYLKYFTQYYSNQITKAELWDNIVYDTRVEVLKVRDAVNKELLNDNGTNFLKVAYEEVLFPVNLLAKKKYYGIPHVDAPNFEAKIFIRGLDMRKKGIPNIVKRICTDILDKSVNINEIRSVRQIVYDTINELYNREWPYDDFVNTCMYKPNKKNIKVHKFVLRMKEEYDITIQPLERIQYVIVDKVPFKHTIDGKTTKLAAGDYMELLTIAKEQKLKLNFDMYMSSYIEGQLGRFITYDIDIADDKKAFDIAKEWIICESAKYRQHFINPHRVYQSVYKDVRKKLNNKIESIYGVGNITRLLNGESKYYIDDMYNSYRDESIAWAKLMHEFLVKVFKDKVYLYYIKNEFYIRRLYAIENGISNSIDKDNIIDKIVAATRKDTDYTDGVDKEQRLNEADMLINAELLSLTQLKTTLMEKYRLTELIKLIKVYHMKNTDTAPEHCDIKKYIFEDPDIDNLNL